nr:IclR family transcriptional regulator [uncultured Holophaga sp.]
MTEHKPQAPAPLEKAGDKTRLLERAYDILMALNDHPDGLSIREICHYVKLPRSTVRRILETFEDQNIVLTPPSTSVYRLGPTLARFASNIRPFDIANIARPMVMQLASKTDECVYLCVTAHRRAVVMDLITGIQPLHMVAAMGSSLPLYATACGKALLATLNDAELADLKANVPLVRLTRNTHTTWEPILSEIEEIRRTGIALDNEEFQTGICGIAIPLKGPGGELGSMSIPMPSERFHAIGDQVIRFLFEGTQALHWRRWIP